MTRLPVTKTFKLFIGGAFTRSESGRSFTVENGSGAVYAHLCLASRKDLRDAVEAARAAQPSWADRSAYNRGQIIYRMAEMMESRHDAFAEAVRVTDPDLTAAGARRAVEASIDRLVAFAGWTDKFPPLLGGQNPVAGPYYNITIPEATGVYGVVPPDDPALLGLVSLVAPALCAGNTVVVVAGDEHPLAATLLGEVCATSDVPAGVVNVLTGRLDELLPHLARHHDVDGVVAANVTRKQAKLLRGGTAENVKRVHIVKRDEEGWADAEACESPWSIEPFVEMKTLWHPART
jgi:acyl-CoA reductase-like NAD-dependent aldehyde dehydrogenase